MKDLFKNKINYKKVAFYSTFIFLIILGRVIFLDADLPASTNLLNLYPFDEGFYTQPAFNLYNYGTLTHQIVPYIFGDSGVANLFQTTLTYVSLLVFGNNYYGVRMPAVIISLITIWLLYLTLKNIKEEDNKFTSLSILFTILYIITDFQYLSISRIWVPTVFRIFFITLILYLFSRYYKKSYKDFFNYKNIFILSFLSMSSIFFIYIYNIFIYVATIFTIFIVSIINNKSKNIKQIIKDCLFILLGSITSLLIFITYIYYTYKFTILDYIKYLAESTNQIKYITTPNSTIAFISNIIKTFSDTLSTNIFRLNISFLFLFLLFIPIFLKILIKSKNTFYILIINLLLFQFFQSTFENTYFYRRLTVLLPVILIINFISINKASFYDYKITKQIGAYILIILIFIAYLLYDKIIIDKKFGGLENKIRHGYNGNLTIYFVLFSIFILAITIIFSYKFFLISKYKNILIIYLLMLLPNLFLLFNYTYHFPTYHARDTMIKLAPKINNKIISGKFAHSYRFYNTSTPIINSYHYIDFPHKYNNYGYLIYRLISEKYINYIIQPSFNDGPLNLKNSEKSYIHLKLEELYYAGNGRYIALLKTHLKK